MSVESDALAWAGGWGVYRGEEVRTRAWRWRVSIHAEAGAVAAAKTTQSSPRVERRGEGRGVMSDPGARQLASHIPRSPFLWFPRSPRHHSRQSMTFNVLPFSVL